jgi:formyltetrahydrofolate-dependent phosphoribosylglycinamide formyltransferase
MTARIVVLASGSGTNCQALLDACIAGDLDAAIVAVITNNPDAGVIARAEQAGVAVEVVTHSGRSPEERLEHDRALEHAVARHEPNLVVLAGWMRILGDDFCARFPIINLHPANPGAFPGTRAIKSAFEAWRRGEINESGVMIHWVPDSGVDVGPVIVTESVAFEPGDSLGSFEQRMHLVEHRLIVEGVRFALAAVT